MAICTYWVSTEGVLDLCNGGVSEKTPQYFGPLLPAECMTVFSGQIDDLEVRCDLARTHTHNYCNSLAHVQRVNH